MSYSLLCYSSSSICPWCWQTCWRSPSLCGRICVQTVDPGEQLA